MFCPGCGTWNRTRAVKCLRCKVELPELRDTPREPPDPEISLVRKATGGRYRVLRRLGSGGMAHVYYALHSVLERPLVVKVLHQHLARDPEMRERFRREAEAASQLVHPHVCAIVDYGALGDTVYLVMPYLAGGSLADILVRDRTVPTTSAAAICGQVATALDYAHRRGIIHRDIKPDNVLFHGRLTKTGRAMGTPHYMSPEQAMGRMVDGRSDLYAVGVMLYEMLVGFPPFDGADSYSVGYKQVHETAVAPDVIDSRVPAELSTIVMKCLSKTADERYQSGFALCDALQAFLSGAASPDDSRLAFFSRHTGATATSTE